MSEAMKIYESEFSGRRDIWHLIGMPARGAKLHDALHKSLSFSVYGKLAELSGLEKKDLGTSMK